MEQMKKIRVAMICHFSNSEVRSHLPLDNRKLYGFARKVLRMPQKKMTYGDIAPWDTSSIQFFRDQENIELYVISAHSGLKKDVVSFFDKKVTYYFLNCDVATLLKRIIPNDGLWRRMNPMVGRVRRIVNQVKPDIVVLFGTENAYYSGTVLGLKGYPVYVLCQTIYNNPEREKYDFVDSKNASTEMEIFKKERYFGVYSKKHFDLLRKLVPGAFVFKFGFPNKGILLEPVSCRKKYDFVNFAMGMSEKKGYTDAIEATAIVKKNHPEVKLNLVGSWDDTIKKTLDDLVSKYQLQQNVEFTPFFPKQSDMFLHIQQSRFALLPCKMDHISGTMLQAMQLGLPLVVYKTTGTPSLNKEKRCVLIAELDNVEELAMHMTALMEDSDLADELRKNARANQERKAEIERQNGGRLIKNFYSIIENYRFGKPIPNDQLFNPKQDD